MTFKYAYGITSKTEDGNNIYMGDIDQKISETELINLCEEIQVVYNLSDMYMIKSNNGFNIVTLDKLPLKLIYLINKEYELIDPIYTYMQTFRRGFYTLRTLPNSDKQFFGLLRHKGCFNKSNAHRIFFNNFFGFSKLDKHFIDYDNSFDDSEQVMVIRFMNTKYGWDIDG